MRTYLTPYFDLGEVTSSIFVFRTNVHTREDRDRLAPALSSDTHIDRWNIDLDDIDKVLRIESHDITSAGIRELVQGAGYLCEELPD